MGCEPDELSDHQPLSDLGLDSLAAVELVNWVKSTYGGLGA